MGKNVKKILIVGGGTAGWLSAAFLARQLGVDHPNGVEITLVEASDIPVIGVGEGTFPSIRTTLGLLGMSETEFIRKCDATYKQGIKFVNWRDDPRKIGEHFYYNLFEPAHLIEGYEALAPYWLLDVQRKNTAFCDSVSYQHAVSEACHAPKSAQDKQWFAPLYHAYHLDAGKLAEMLKAYCLDKGVSHLIGKVTSVKQKANGNIAAVMLEGGKIVEADLFIDCTGFAGELIGKTMGAHIKSVGDILLVDRALAVQASYKVENGPIPSATLSTAHEAGWTWDIGLRHRRGIGYVYSSAHTTDERALQVLEKYLGQENMIAEPRLLKMHTGYREKQWLGNCVAIGLSGGFLEPLEATGIVMIESAIRLLVDYFPRTGDFDMVSKLFNRAMRDRYEDAVRFVKLHYTLSHRRDNDFWLDNRRPETQPDGLLELLELWKYRLPNESDFASRNRVFSHDVYQYVLLGMGYETDISANSSAYPFLRQAQEAFARLDIAKKNAISGLPSHRDLIEQIHNDENFSFGMGTQSGP